MGKDDRPKGNLGMLARLATDKDFRRSEREAAKQVTGVGRRGEETEESD